MTYEEAVKEVEAIEAVLKDYANGCDNRKAKTLISYHVFRLRCSAKMDNYCKEKLANILSESERLYSARKHQNYPGGADAMRVSILGYCGGVREGLDDSA